MDNCFRDSKLRKPRMRNPPEKASSSFLWLGTGLWHLVLLWFQLLRRTTACVGPSVLLFCLCFSFVLPTCFSKSQTWSLLPLQTQHCFCVLSREEAKGSSDTPNTPVLAATPPWWCFLHWWWVSLQHQRETWLLVKELSEALLLSVIDWRENKY